MGVVVAAGIERDLLTHIDANVVVVVEGEIEQTLERLKAEYAVVDVVVLGPDVDNPIHAARLIEASHPDAGILILVDPEHEARFREELRFTPLLPRHVRHFRADAQEDVLRKLDRMIADARERRHFNSTIQQLNKQLSNYGPTERRRELVLDVLLKHAPIGIILIGEDRRVLDINSEACRLLDVAPMATRGQDLGSAFREGNGREVSDLIDQVLDNPSRPASAVLRIDQNQTDLELTAVGLAEDSRAYGTLLIMDDVTTHLAAQSAENELEKQRAVGTALEAQSEELHRLNEELRRSNRELQEFAYIASHDLQEPLRKISSFADLLINEHGGELSDEARFFVDRLQSAAIRMGELIRGLLEFSRVRTQAYAFEPVDLNRVLEEVLSDLSIAIEETDAKIEASKLPTIAADATQMRQLFQNLIGNSLKFTAPGVSPVIGITSEPFRRGRRAEWHRVTLSDNGIGFESESAEKIFSPFQRLNAREYPGTGMGLAICRRIVERHGGSISAESQPGQGSAFTFELPERQPEEMQ